MLKCDIPPIESGQLRLRLLERSDLPMTLRWRNQDHIRRWFIHSDLISSDQHERWFEEYLQRDNDYLFIIEETSQFGKPVGQISLYNIDWEHKRGEFGRLLVGEPEAQCKGIAKEASSLLLNYAFTTLGFDEVELSVRTDNKPALAMYLTLGFREINESNGVRTMLRRRNLSPQ
jgi:diamine N-acetyltransferase